jgi:hypothetical protein
MVVQITNLTDASGCKHSPTQVDIYNKTLDPGAVLRIPADLIDKKIRALEENGLISIGPIPSWYAHAKTKKGTTITPEEKERRISRREIKKVELTVVSSTSVGEKVAMERKKKG